MTSVNTYSHVNPVVLGECCSQVNDVNSLHEVIVLDIKTIFGFFYGTWI